MAELHLIIGPMFAGKSCELIRRIRLLKVLKKNYIVIKPVIDDRYDVEMIVSHNYDKEHCISLNKLNNILNLPNIKDEIHTIFIDEGQFFPDLKETVIYLVEVLQINVVVSGLDGDSKRNKFGSVLDLIPYSNTCSKINAACILCLDGTPAPFSFRNANNNDQILIGSTDKYMSLCRSHFLEMSKDN